MEKKALVVGHERSGNHFLINSIGLNFDFDMSECGSCPNCVEIPTCMQCQTPQHGRGTSEDLWRHNLRLQKAYLSDYLEMESQVEGEKRIYKTHNDLDFFDIEQLKSTFNIFYITRDPKDTLWSFYLYLGGRRKPTRLWDKTLVPSPKWQWSPNAESLSNFLFNERPEFYEHGSTHVIDHYDWQKHENFIERWYVKASEWQANAEALGIQIITYENLINSFENQIENISKNINIPIPETITKPTLKAPSISPRKGIIGDHKNFFSAEIHKKFDALLEKYKEKYGPLATTK